MSLMAIGWDELRLAENPAVELPPALGYTYVAADDREPERRSFKEPILTDRLIASFKRLNSWFSNTNVTKAVKAVTQFPTASIAERPTRRSAPRSPTESRWRQIAGSTEGATQGGSPPVDTR